MKINVTPRINEFGQSILEVAVSLGLIMVIVTILTVTTINGLKNSQFAKNQILASSYAEQAIELVKSVRQRDCPVTITDTSLGTNRDYYWSDRSNGHTIIWEYVTSNPLPEGNTYAFTINTGTGVNCKALQNNTTAGGETLNTVFNRKIKLERLDTSVNRNVIRVTATVNWSDYSGNHTVENVSIITNY